jgi:hypothetical protein
MLTEIVTLPSKGLIYPQNNLLASGQVEMKYMTAKEEDILTNVNYLKNGTAVDKLLESLIVTKININDLVAGDKKALMVAARILGYGKDYEFKYFDSTSGEYIPAKVDLTEIKEKPLDESLFSPGINEFTYTFEKTGNQITFKILNGTDEKAIEAEIKGLKKLDPKASYEIVTRLRYMITSVNGDKKPLTINDFISKGLLASESRELRLYYNKIQPDLDMKYYPEEDYTQEGIDIPININFFWPDFGK